MTKTIGVMHLIPNPKPPRLVSFHVSNHYWAFLVLTALGTSFFPVGVRAGWEVYIGENFGETLLQVHHHS